MHLAVYRKSNEVNYYSLTKQTHTFMIMLQGLIQRAGEEILVFDMH
jgi:hypothetical protein